MNITITIPALAALTWKEDGGNTLPELQAAVEGYIEAVPGYKRLRVSDILILRRLWESQRDNMKSGERDIQSSLDAIVALSDHLVEKLGAEGRLECFAFCNELGKMQEKPANLDATLLWAVSLGVPMDQLRDTLLGTVVIVAGAPDFIDP